LGGIEITPTFYKLKYMPTYISIFMTQVARWRREWKTQAKKQLQIAFPDAMVATKSAHITCLTSKERSDAEEMPQSFNELRRQFEASVDLSLSATRKRKISDSDDGTQRQVGNLCCSHDIVEFLF
jgi:hypothetical protein